MEVLHIVAKIVVNPEFREELLPAFKELVEKSRAEPGNISYELMQEQSDQNVFMMLEQWKSLEAINLHNNSAHFKNFRKFAHGKLANMSVNILKKLL